MQAEMKRENNNELITPVFIKASVAETQNLSHPTAEMATSEASWIHLLDKRPGPN
jgi:hypothetical protein